MQEQMAISSWKSGETQSFELSHFLFETLSVAGVYISGESMENIEVV